MKILNQDTDTSVDEILLCLTKNEAKELIDSLNDIIQRPDCDHAHIPSDDYKKELTVCLYDQHNLDHTLSERLKRLITTDR